MAGSILSPQMSSDFSLLDPSPAGSKPQLLPTEAQPTLALTLFEKPVGSARLPQEYASFPLSPGWDNKVCVCVHVCLSTLNFCNYCQQNETVFPGVLMLLDILASYSSCPRFSVLKDNTIVVLYTGTHLNRYCRLCAVYFSA